MKFWLSPLSLLGLSSLSSGVSSMVTTFVPAAAKTQLSTIPGLGAGNKSHFTVIEHPSERGATVLEAPVKQEGVRLFLAIDSDSFGNIERPGNGGIRLLNYESTQLAIDDAVRLAKGMTRKHDMFR
jgi:hypothetical protein